MNAIKEIKRNIYIKHNIQSLYKLNSIENIKNFMLNFFKKEYSYYTVCNFISIWIFIKEYIGEKELTLQNINYMIKQIYFDNHNNYYFDENKFSDFIFINNEILKELYPNININFKNIYEEVHKMTNNYSYKDELKEMSNRINSYLFENSNNTINDIHKEKNNNISKELEELMATLVDVFLNPTPKKEKLNITNNNTKETLQNEENKKEREKEETEEVKVIEDPLVKFLKENSPQKIKEELDKYIISQDDVKEKCALFYYYHILRRVKPNLPIHNLLVLGPSGSGKTEIWRTLDKIYNLVPIRIIDGSTLTCEGIKGNNKISTNLTEDVVNGGIIIIDEFDKLCEPSFTGQGENVSYRLQSELLKLLEDEYKYLTRDGNTIKSNGISVCMLGAFEALYEEKEKIIGFNNDIKTLNDNFISKELIKFGIRPEIVGRITTICETKPLSDEDYFNIINNSNSRVLQLTNELNITGAKSLDKKYVQEIINKSKQNNTGVRWVLHQIENELLNEIYNNGCEI